MKKKNIVISIVVLCIWIVVAYAIFSQQINHDAQKIVLDVNMQTELNDEIQIFYSSSDEFDDGIFDINYSYTHKLNFVDGKCLFSGEIPSDTKYIRLDLGNATKVMIIDNIDVRYNETYFNLSKEQLNNVEYTNDVELEKADVLTIRNIGEDPYVVWKIDTSKANELIKESNHKKDIIVKIIMELVWLVICLLLFKWKNKIATLANELKENRRMIFDLAKNDFRNKFSGSYFGVFWAFVNPIVVVVIYWFVFDIGFKSAPVSNYPYVLWLIAGICPWFFFNEALNSGTTSLFDYSYIVKKMVFKVSLLPLIKIISAAFVHLFFIGLVLFVYIIYGEIPSVYFFQVFYYSFCTFMLALGITYMTSSLSVFFKDLAQIVNIILQFGMWLTPIMYSETTFGPEVQKIFKYNPMYYIVSGYRDCFINDVGVWNHGKLTIYFWSITCLLFIIGTVVYKKLRPHFADVL